MATHSHSRYPSFAAALFLYCPHKAHDPAINHTEEPMDFAFLNGILRSPRFAAQRPLDGRWNLSAITISATSP
jgi:hypothetical protein